MRKDHTTGRANVLDGEFIKLPADFRLTSGMTASADLLIGKRKLMTYSQGQSKGFRKHFRSLTELRGLNVITCIPHKIRQGCDRQ